MTPTVDDVMRLLGYAIHEAQETEASVHIAYSIMFKLSTAQSVEHLQSVYAKKTLGQLHSMVRDKVNLNPSFDEAMEKYITQRNFIIHNLTRTSVFSIYTAEGRESLAALLNDFRIKSRKFKLTYTALLEIWMRALTKDRANPINSEKILGTDLFEEIERDYIPNLRSIFFHAENPSTGNLL